MTELAVRPDEFNPDRPTQTATDRGLDAYRAINELTPRPAVEQAPATASETPDPLEQARAAIERAEATVIYTGPTPAQTERPAARVEQPVAKVEQLVARPVGRGLEGGREGMDRADVIALSFVPGQIVRMGLGAENQGWSIVDINNPEKSVTIHRNLPNADGTPGKTFETLTMTPRELAMRNFNVLDNNL
jgi:hypothetical protein